MVVRLESAQHRTQLLVVPRKIALGAPQTAHLDSIDRLQMSRKVSGEKTTSPRDQDPHVALPKNSARRSWKISTARS